MVELVIKRENLTVSQQFSRYVEAIGDEINWFNYVQIKDFTSGAIIPFEMWPHLRYQLILAHYYPQLCVLKSKQVGDSWLWAGHALYKCGKGVANVLEFSKGEDDAADLLDKSRFINSKMPNWLQLRTGKDGAEMITFPDVQSRIMAFPSTEDAGAGQTASLVLRDENDFHRCADENFENVKPTVDAGAQIIDFSTSRRAKQNTHFKNNFRKALASENNYKAVFIPWYYRPGRDAAWYYKTMRDYYPIWRFLQNYPTTIDEALGAIAGRGLIDATKIDELNGFAREPSFYNGPAMIFRWPNPNWHYYAGGDASEGRGGDYQVLWIEGTDGQNRELVALIHTNNLTYDLFAFTAYSLLTQYGRPLLVMGNDAWGGMVLEALAKLGYNEQIYNSDEKGDKLGYTEDKKNKQQNFARFGITVRDGLKVPYREAINEMAAMALNDEGFYESTAAHDDLVVAAAKATLAFNIMGGVQDAVTSQDFS